MEAFSRNVGSTTNLGFYHGRHSNDCLLFALQPRSYLRATMPQAGQPLPSGREGSTYMKLTSNTRAAVVNEYISFKSKQGPL